MPSTREKVESMMKDSKRWLIDDISPLMNYFNDMHVVTILHLALDPESFDVKS